MFTQIDHLKCVASTNDYLRQFALAGKPRMAVADAQTEGRGRYGRRWLSPAGMGLYVSYLVYPGWDAGRSHFLNYISSLAVVRAIRGLEQPVSVHVKAPNDILLNEKKVAGILTELVSTGYQINHAIVGIGVNLYQDSFPPGLSGRATSLVLEGVDAPGRNEFCDVLTVHYVELYSALEQGHWDEIEEAYRRETK